MATARKFGRLTPGVHAEPPPMLHDVPQLGVVSAVSAAGAMVVVDAMPGLEYGPCPWGLGSHDTPQAAVAAGFAPRHGDRVLLVFAGVGVSAPVVTAWWR